MHRLRLGLLALAALFIATNSAHASTMTCSDFSLSVTTGAVATCFSDVGTGNVGSFPSPYDSFLFLDQDSSVGGGTAGTFLQMTSAGGPPHSGGGFTIAPGAWDFGNSLIVVLQGPVGNSTPDFAGFVVTGGSTTGTWTLPNGQSLVSGSLFVGNESPNGPVVPEPASLILLGSGLLGIARSVRNRRTGQARGSRGSDRN